MAQIDASSVPEGSFREDSGPVLKYWTPGLIVFFLIWLAGYFAFFDRPFQLAAQNWPLIFVGFAGALLGNATAVGGGLVFIPVMVFIYHLEAVTALKLAITAQSWGMTSGAIGWLKRQAVPLNGLKYTVPGLLIGSTISTLVIRPNAYLVKGLFGPASIFIGIVTLVLLNRKGTVDEIPEKARWPLLGMALLGGLITGWVAIGEGEVIAAFLMLVYGLRAKRGIGLGVVLLSINSIYLFLLHQFFLGGIPWDMVVFVGLGCVFGARLGPYLTQWISEKALKLGFATIAITDGFIFVIQYLMSLSK